MNIQEDPKFVPHIRSIYTHDLTEMLGHLRPDERIQLQESLKAVDEEEARTARLYAAGKTTDTIWENLWREWQDRRRKIRTMLDSVQQQQKTHVKNLDVALSIIAQVGIVYNSLIRSDQKELLGQMVERVIVNPTGKAKLELRAPFAYLSDISSQIRGSGAEISGFEGETKIGSESAADFHEAQRLD